MVSSILATYFVQTWMDLGKAVDTLAGEQSSGTFIKVAAETPELQERHRAKVESLEEVEPSAHILPGSVRPPSAHLSAAIIRIRFPLENVGASIPNLLATVAGNLFELQDLAGIKLLDVELPNEFAEAYRGPQFGVDGTRQLMGVPSDKPMIGAIVKPSVGLKPEEYAQLIEILARAGIDFVKDDELIGNPPYSPLEDRVKAVMAVINRVAQETGKKVMYAFNITDETDRMLRHRETVLAHGGNCVMVCPNTVGLPALKTVADQGGAVVHGHRAMFGALARSPALGLHFKVFQKLVRLAGADHIHTNGLNNKFYEDNETVAQSIAAVQEPMLGGFPILPVLSSSQSAATVEPTWDAVRSKDVLMVAGGGIAGHPLGPAAGVQSIRDAWDCVLNGTSPSEERDNDILQAALRTFGQPTAQD